jgi:hypothetical protein
MYVWMRASVRGLKACVRACMHACLHACMVACMHVCMFVGFYVCMYVRMYVCVCSLFLSPAPSKHVVLSRTRRNFAAWLVGP